VHPCSIKSFPPFMSHAQENIPALHILCATKNGAGLGTSAPNCVVFLVVLHIRNNCWSYSLLIFPSERTDKIPLGSIKKVTSEPIKGHEEYHIMVS